MEWDLRTNPDTSGSSAAFLISENSGGISRLVLAGSRSLVSMQVFHARYSTKKKEPISGNSRRFRSPRR